MRPLTFPGASLKSASCPQNSGPASRALDRAARCLGFRRQTSEEIPRSLRLLASPYFAISSRFISAFSGSKIVCYQNDWSTRVRRRSHINAKRVAINCSGKYNIATGLRVGAWNVVSILFNNVFNCAKPDLGDFRGPGSILSLDRRRACRARQSQRPWLFHFLGSGRTELDASFLPYLVQKCHGWVMSSGLTRASNSSALTKPSLMAASRRLMWE